MHELMFQAGVKGMSERSELIPCSILTIDLASYLLLLYRSIQTDVKRK